MHHLLYKVSEANYIEYHRGNELTNSVTDLFWAYPISVGLLRVFLGIIIIDCMFKTNRYNYPLLEIDGMTSANMIFAIVFAFLD